MSDKILSNYPVIMLINARCVIGPDFVALWMSPPSAVFGTSFRGHQPFVVSDYVPWTVLSFSRVGYCRPPAQVPESESTVDSPPNLFADNKLPVKHNWAVFLTLRAVVV